MNANAGRERAPILATAFVAILFRLEYIREIRLYPEFLQPILDSAANLAWAKDWIHGLAVQGPYFRAPGAIWGIGAGLLAVGEDPVRLAVAQILAGALTPILIALLARAMFGTAAAWIAGLGAAVFPMFPFHDGQLLDSFLQIPLVVAAALLSWNARDGSRPRASLVAGFVWGLAATVRPPLLLAGLVPPVLLARTRRSAAVFALVGLFAAPLAVSLRNAAAGDFVFIASQGGLNLYLGNSRAADGVSATFPDEPTALGYAMIDAATRRAERAEGRALRDSEVSAHYARRVFDEIQADPASWARLLVKKTVLFWSRREIPNNHDPVLFAESMPILRWPGWGLWAPLGLAGFMTMRRRAGARFLAALVAAVFVSSVLFFVAARFRLPAAPFLLVLAGGGIADCWRGIRVGERKTAMTFVAWTAAFAVLFAANPYAIPREPWIASYVMTAEAERDRGEPMRALAWIDRALARDPTYYPAHRARIDLLRRIGRFEEAREVADRLVVTAPGDAALHAELGALCDLTGDSERAFEEFNRALSIDPNLEAALVHRGVARARRGEIEAAKIELRRFLEERPRSPEAPRARSVLDAIERGTFPSN